MWDILKCLGAGFTGKLEHLREARKLVWMLLLAYLAGWGCTLFAAWIGYTSYRTMLGNWIAGADFIAWVVTIVMAGSIYFLLSYLSGFAVERWMKVPAHLRDYSALGFRITLVAFVLIGFMEYSMEIQGGRNMVHNSAEQIAPPDFTGIHAVHANGMEADRKKLDELTHGQLGYTFGWKDPKTGIFHLNKKGTKLQAQLTESIATSQRLEERQAAAAQLEYDQAEATRTQYIADNTRIVNFTVQILYFIIGLLGIICAFCVETIQLAMSTSGAHGYEAAPAHAHGIGHTQSRTPATASTASPLIGFTFSPLPDQELTDPEEKSLHKGYEITCKNCNTLAVMASPRAEYCSDACRGEAWEKRTGAKLRKALKAN